MATTFKKIDSDKFQIIETEAKIQNVSLSGLEDQKQILLQKVAEIDAKLKELKKL